MVSNKAGLFYTFKNENNAGTSEQSVSELYLLLNSNWRIIGAGGEIQSLFGHFSSGFIGKSYLELFRESAKLDSGINLVELKDKVGNVSNYIEREVLLNGSSDNEIYRLKTLNPVDDLSSTYDRTRLFFKVSDRISNLIFKRTDRTSLVKDIISIFSELISDLNAKIILIENGSVNLVFANRRKHILEKKMVSRNENNNKYDKFRSEKPCIDLLKNLYFSNKKSFELENLFRCSSCGAHVSQNMNVGLIPVFHENEVYGFICLSSKEPKKPFLNSEEAYLLKNIARDLGMAIKTLEIERKRKEALNKIKDNIEYFEYLADRLRNPLAIMQCFIDVNEDIGTEKTFKTLSEQIQRINKILEDLRKREIETFHLKETL